MTAVFKRTEKKFNGFWQVDIVEFLIDERKLLMMKLDYIWSHLSTAFNSKKLFTALPQGMASTINNFANYFILSRQLFYLINMRSYAVTKPTFLLSKEKMHQ